MGNTISTCVGRPDAVEQDKQVVTVEPVNYEEIVDQFMSGMYTCMHCGTNFNKRCTDCILARINRRYVGKNIYVDLAYCDVIGDISNRLNVGGNQYMNVSEMRSIEYLDSDDPNTHFTRQCIIGMLARNKISSPYDIVLLFNVNTYDVCCIVPPPPDEHVEPDAPDKYEYTEFVDAFICGKHICRRCNSNLHIPFNGRKICRVCKVRFMTFRDIGTRRYIDAHHHTIYGEYDTFVDNGSQYIDVTDMHMLCYLMLADLAILNTIRRKIIDMLDYHEIWSPEVLLLFNPHTSAVCGIAYTPPIITDIEFSDEDSDGDDDTKYDNQYRNEQWRDYHAKLSAYDNCLYRYENGFGRCMDYECLCRQYEENPEYIQKHDELLNRRMCTTCSYRKRKSTIACPRCALASQP